MIGQQCGLWLWSFMSWSRCIAQLGNLYLEYCTFCCTTWKSLSGILHFLLHHLEIFIWNTALSAAPLGSFSEILHFLLHCLQIIISNAALSTALKKKIIKKIQYVMKVNGGRCTIHWHNSKSGSLWWHISHHVWRREKMNELGRKKLGQTHAVGKECKAIVSLSPDRDSPRQLWGLCRGNHDFCMHSTPPCEPNRWEAAATYVCVCTYWSKLDTGVNAHAHRLHWTQSQVLLQHKMTNLYTTSCTRRIHVQWISQQFLFMECILIWTWLASNGNKFLVFAASPKEMWVRERACNIYTESLHILLKLRNVVEKYHCYNWQRELEEKKKKRRSFSLGFLFCFTTVAHTNHEMLKMWKCLSLCLTCSSLQFIWNVSFKLMSLKAMPHSDFIWSLVFEPKIPSCRIVKKEESLKKKK